jgi:hypothetical protein
MTYPLEFKQKFVYQENERGIFIPLTLVYGAKTTACGAKLDTGADFCYFSREHAEEIGLQVEEGTVFRVETNRPEQPKIFYGQRSKFKPSDMKSKRQSISEKTIAYHAICWGAPGGSISSDSP